MLDEKKSGFHVVMSHHFFSGGHLKGEGAVMYIDKQKD